MQDQYGRKIEYLRISVTDKCNFRCVYCMPEDGVEYIEHEEVMRFEEVLRVCRCAVQLGIHEIKITGGEPLVRHGVCDLIRQISAIDGIDSVTLTTNGYLLRQYLPQLKSAGVTGINVSLDTLDPQHFHQITRNDGLSEVLAGIKEAVSIGIPSVKINCVPMRGNQDDFVGVAMLAKDAPVHVRFIELMPIGMGQEFDRISQEQMIENLEARIGKLIPVQEHLGNGPAVYYKADGFLGRIGFISAISHEFCQDCNRIRMTVDGYLKLCLNYSSHINVRDYIRSGATDEELEHFLKAAIYGKPRHHGFLEKNNAEKESRKMVEIGG
ncbi:MAG: GTP 3',8-cyclase MoaA [Lachnospiraceae bacterium]|nr:GTP 3',8-cyclase MoaA [Lachnospiraceae bacterium]MDD3617464.1 GTP 3',8-cyclase MoaA [Lachnospiraceae bacterium]